jgi:hypothetical protein
LKIKKKVEIIVLTMGTTMCPGCAAYCRKNTTYCKPCFKNTQRFSLTEKRKCEKIKKSEKERLETWLSSLSWWEWWNLTEQVIAEKKKDFHFYAVREFLFSDEEWASVVAEFYP